MTARRISTLLLPVDPEGKALAQSKLEKKDVVCASSTSSASGDMLS